MSFNFSDLRSSDGGDITPIKQSYSPSHSSTSSLNVVPLTPSPPSTPAPYTPIQTSLTYLTSSYELLQTSSTTRPYLSSLLKKTSTLTTTASNYALSKAPQKISQHINSTLPEKIDSFVSPYISSCVTFSSSTYSSASETVKVLKDVEPVVKVCAKVLPIETTKKLSVWLGKKVWEYKSGTRVEC
ncbi:hypothetical protein TrST_g1934 [Triparma strigata]|uniref:Uncharacterized protein n=1 Tax=Triparma strigata TaxID=1606541 RepID=A0A9W7B085_9STRA|nr:hypothetical protein TrST_g1934 [Triparma strigata]